VFSWIGFHHHGLSMYQSTVLARPSSKLALADQPRLGNELGGVDRIATVMAWVISDEDDQVAIALSAASRLTLIEDITYGVHDLEIGALVAAPTL
jgi:hypothetical protein